MSIDNTFNDPDKKKKLQDAVRQASDSKIREDAEKDYRKGLADEMKEELELSKREFNRLVKTYYEESIEEMREDFNRLEFLYETVTDEESEDTE